MKKRLIIGAVALLNALFFIGCSTGDTDDGESDTPPAVPTYTVTYDGNGYTDGAVPEDLTEYKSGELVTVADGTDLKKDSSLFQGWRKTGEGGLYGKNATFRIYANTTLEAVWEDIAPAKENIKVDGGTDTLTITATGGSFVTDAKAYIKNDGTAVTIAITAPTGSFTELAAERVTVTENIITLKFPKLAAPGGSADNLHSTSQSGEETVTVTIETDAQTAPVTITAETSTSPVWQLAQGLDANLIAGYSVDNILGTVTLPSAGVAGSVFNITSITVFKGTELIVPAGKTLSIRNEGILSIESGGTLSVEGGEVQANEDSKIIIKANGVLEIFIKTVGSYTFNGTVTFNKTVFGGVGTWTASRNDITITSSTNGASLSSAAGVLTAAGTSPTITQQRGENNALTIGAGVTIDLGATSTEGKVGEIILIRDDENNPGKLVFAGANAQVIAASGTIPQIPAGTTGVIGDFSSASFIDTAAEIKMKVSSFGKLIIKGDDKKLVSIEYNGTSANDSFITGPEKHYDGFISAVTDCKN
ncbi:MAG: hypothetical protein LBB43_01300 [Spirochaetaceae bacterium]|nr:hypothetical protein [Spirochaetaceae bacterium]